MRRRALSLLLAGAALVLAGCGGGTDTGPGTSESRQARSSLAAYLATVDLRQLFVFATTTI